MQAAGLPFPDIDPILIEIGPFAIRWYALAYVAGLLLGWRYVVRLVETPALWPKGKGPATREHVDDLLLWAALGVILGGRLGYVVFYNAPYYLQHPLEAFAVWQGGMSFHGGFLGVVVAIIWYAKRNSIDMFSLGDTVAAATPIGLFFGRLANFINAELWGRTTDLPWGVVFPGAGPDPRHPSQLYEAALEGILLFVILRYLTHHTNALRTPGVAIGAFIAGYGTFRTMVEFVREPDAHIGFLAGGLTMGMLLSVPMALAGFVIIAWARRRAPAPSDSKGR